MRGVSIKMGENRPFTYLALVNLATFPWILKSCHIDNKSKIRFDQLGGSFGPTNADFFTASCGKMQGERQFFICQFCKQLCADVAAEPIL